MSHYDMHLAAAEISKHSIDLLQKKGFVRDEFANLTCCHTGEFHGTFKDENLLPSDELWSEICSILEFDEQFSGYLEEEVTETEWRRVLFGQSSQSPENLPQINLIECPAGRHKACDIHIGINIETSLPSAIKYIEQLQCSSVDRPSPEGIRRVYTITCEVLEDGELLFLKLYKHLSAVEGLYGRMKLEKTTRHYRKPDDAVTLPLATNEAVTEWLFSVQFRQERLFVPNTEIQRMETLST